MNDLKVSDLLNIMNALNNNEANKDTSNFWKIGKKYFIRTVTMHQVGELVEINDKEIVLKNASWVADSGRWYNALKDGSLDEVEPFVDDVLVNRQSIVDATVWNHDLPAKQK